VPDFNHAQRRWLCVQRADITCPQQGASELIGRTSDYIKVDDHTSCQRQQPCSVEEEKTYPCSATCCSSSTRGRHCHAGACVAEVRAAARKTAVTSRVPGLTSLQVMNNCRSEAHAKHCNLPRAYYVVGCNIRVHLCVRMCMSMYAHMYIYN
jgi:hypothetical protein